MVLFRAEDVGQPKVHVAARRLAEINPQVQVRAVQGDLRTDLGLGDFRSADLVLGCLDSVNARWALNRKCMQAGVDWIDGGISDFHGLVAHYSPTAGACYECTFTPRTLERFNRRYSCPFGLVSSQAEEKVPTTAVTTSVIAAIQVQQALMMLHGLDEGLQAGERLSVYLKPFLMTRDRLPADPDCLAHFSLPVDIPRMADDPGLTVGAVLRAARAIDPAVDALELPFELVTEFTCPACGERQVVLRPKEKVRQAETACPHCAGMRQPQVVSTIQSGSDLETARLVDLGIAPREILTFSTSQGKVYLQLA